jgi:hypothetical protein
VGGIPGLNFFDFFSPDLSLAIVAVCTTVFPAVDGPETGPEESSAPDTPAARVDSGKLGFVEGCVAAVCGGFDEVRSTLSVHQHISTNQGRFISQLTVQEHSSA